MDETYVVSKWPPFYGYSGVWAEWSVASATYIYGGPKTYNPEIIQTTSGNWLKVLILEVVDKDNIIV